MIRKTLGGQRLGSGKKMDVEMHGYERSTHNLSKVLRTTVSPGTLVPFMNLVALPGDTFDIDLSCDIMTHPTIGPLFGSFKVQLDVFQIPMRLYNSYLTYNKSEVGLDMSKIKMPQYTMRAFRPDVEPQDIDNSQINPSSLLSYLGLRGIGRIDPEIESATATREFNAIPWLGYWDIYFQYYANKQEEIGGVIHGASIVLTDQTVDEINITNGMGTTLLPVSPTQISLQGGLSTTIEVTYTGTAPDPKQILINTSTNGVKSMYDLCSGVLDQTAGQILGTYNAMTWGITEFLNWRYATNADLYTVAPNVTTFPLENINKMRRDIMAWNNTTAPFLITAGSEAPYGYMLQYSGNDVNNALNAQEGLAVKTYQSDLFNNWLRDEYINYISSVSSVSTAGDSFSIDSFNFASKVYKLLNRIAVSDGTYESWVETVYGEEMMRRATTPMYMGGLQKELIFQEVISQSQTEGQALGTLAGKGRLAQGGKGGTVVIKVKEPSYIMGIFSLTPRTDYSQGNRWDVHLKTWDDLHKPQLDEIGFQDLITEQMAWWDTTWNSVAWLQNSAGKQPAWINYMTDYNETKGNFAIQSNEMFMTLNRRYEYSAETGIIDLTTLVDPAKYNFIFAETSPDAMNFWVQVGMDIVARRVMSAKIMPNL